MADHSTIEWTDSTWQPITGCSVVSPGCTNCYAMKLAGTRLRNHPSREGLTTMSKAGPVWNGKVRFNAEWLTQPLTWKKPRKIFVCAHGDLFHEGVPDDWIDKVFAVMALCPQHTFQVLTKRAERMRGYLSDPLRRNAIELAAEAIQPSVGKPWSPKHCIRWPLPNVWLGVSCEDQATADERIPLLLQTPAAVRFVSAEPLLGPIAFRDEQAACLDWLICGGESGPNARRMLRAWSRSLRDQCRAAGVAYFHKQNGEWIDADEWLDDLECGPSRIFIDRQLWKPQRPLNFEDAATLANISGWKYEHQSDGTALLRVGKKRAGRLLDGVEHNEFPQVQR